MGCPRYVGGAVETSSALPRPCPTPMHPPMHPPMPPLMAARGADYGAARGLLLVAWHSSPNWYG